MNFNFEDLNDIENSQQLIEFINSLHTSLLKIEPEQRLEIINEKIGYCKNVQKIKYILQQCEKHTLAELTAVTKPKTEAKPKSDIAKKYNGKYVGIDWVVEEFGVAKQTVYGWTHRRLIPFTKIGKPLLFNKQEVYEHAQCLKVKTIRELKQDTLNNISRGKKNK